MKKLIPIFAALILVCFKAEAQDPTFSQYHNTPYLTNPGMISVKPDAVVGVNYRTQWRGIETPFTTFMVGGYYPILSKDKFRTFGSAGAYILTDKKPGGMLRSTGFGLNGAYKLPLNFANFMHFGIQFSYFQTRLGSDGLSTGSQWNGSGYDPNLDINEDPGQRKGVPAVSLGAQWVNEDVYGDIRYMAGIAAYNLNRPNLALYRGGDVNDNLSIRYVLNGGIRAVKVQNLVLFPTVRLQVQGPAWQAQVGTLFRYGINDGPNQGDGFIKNGTIGLGAWYQVKQAVVAMVEFTQPNYAISFNYDFGASGLRTDNANANAAEFFLMYKKTLGRRKKVDIRYYRTRDQDIIPITPTEGGEVPQEPAAPTTPNPAPTPVPAPPPSNLTPPSAPAPQQTAPATRPAAPKATTTSKKPTAKVTQKGVSTGKAKTTKPGAKAGTPKAKPAASVKKPASTKAKPAAAKGKSSSAKPKPKK